MDVKFIRLERSFSVFGNGVDRIRLKILKNYSQN
jgi:hypothetical protein